MQLASAAPPLPAPLPRQLLDSVAAQINSPWKSQATNSPHHQSNSKSGTSAEQFTNSEHLGAAGSHLSHSTRNCPHASPVNRVGNLLCGGATSPVLQHNMNCNIPALQHFDCSTMLPQSEYQSRSNDSVQQCILNANRESYSPNNPTQIIDSSITTKKYHMNKRHNKMKKKSSASSLESSPVSSVSLTLDPVEYPLDSIRFSPTPKQETSANFIDDPSIITDQSNSLFVPSDSALGSKNSISNRAQNNGNWLRNSPDVFRYNVASPPHFLVESPPSSKSTSPLCAVNNSTSCSKLTKLRQDLVRFFIIIAFQ